MWLKNFGMSKHSVSREKLEKRIAAGVYEILEVRRSLISMNTRWNIWYDSGSCIFIWSQTWTYWTFVLHHFFQNVEKSSGTEVDLQHMLTNSLGNVINDIIFGFKFPAEDKTWVWFRQIQEEGCHEMGVAGAVNFLPFVRWVIIDYFNQLWILDHLKVYRW